MNNYKTKVKDILDLIKSNRLCPMEGSRLLQEVRESSAASLNGNGSDTTRIPSDVGQNKDKETSLPTRSSVDLSGDRPDEPISSPYQAIVLTRPGGIDDIQIREIFPQEPGNKEVQILVKAFSINFGALLCVKGLYPTMPNYPFTPGFEVSGIVLKVGRDVGSVSAGDEVIGMAGLAMGGHGALINVDEGAVVKKPSNISYVEACAFPIVFLTMHRAFELARVKKGEKVLIQTAAGGTGLISVQLAQMLEAEVFATAGSQEKLDYLAAMGVRHLINYREEDFAERILQMTDNYGVDVVFNTLSGDAIQKGLDILAPEGRYIELAMTGLKTAHNISLSSLDNNQVFYSVDLRKQLLHQSGVAKQYLDLMVQTLAEGKIKPIIGRIFPFSEVKQAYKYLADRKNIGKVVVTMPEVNLSESVLPTPSVERTINSRHESQAAPGNEIAIIGISGRFPGAKNVDEFWQNLAAGKSSITEVPKDRWDIDAYYDSDHRVLDKTHCRRGGFLSDIDQFDPLFFNISGREAQLTDPQQRLFLEESWTALEDSGYATERIANARCGVFVGVGQSDYLDKMLEEGVEREAQSFWGNDASVLTARLSYFLNLKGAAIAINTACSSSLVAIHLGAQSILSGESELAIAGGVFIRTTPTFHIINSNAAMLSPDGKCMTFDNKANGFVPGEGVGVVILKSLEAALHDGDHVYGVIKSSGINQDGKTNGITAPSTLSQTELELSVYQKADINPETIGLVEAHGTGTKLGDPIEMEALTNAFRKHTDKKQYCAIGAVKTNIGHTVAAAGVAGVIKVLLALKHRQIPPSLNFDHPNEHIEFAESPFYVNTALKDWEAIDNQPRRAAISSFGFSGTNAHLVLEEPPVPVLPTASSRPAYLFALSAKTEEALQQKASDLFSWLATEGHKHRLGDIAFTLHQGRSHFPIRAAMVAGSVEELQRALGALQRREKSQHYLIRNLRETPCVPESAQRRLGNELLGELCDRQHTDDVFRQKLLSVAEWYVKGYDIDWKRLYADRQYRRLAMPTYPFARARYWIPTPSTRRCGEAKSSHPLLDAIDHDLSLKQQGIVFRKLLPPSHPIASHHQVQNQSIVPGVGHLEMAFAALSQIRNSTDYKLINVVWLHPLIVRDDAKEVRVFIKQENERLHYQVQSEEAGQTVVHSRGEFAHKGTISNVSEPRIDIEAIKARCTAQAQSGKKPFTQLRAMGICYGTFFQALSQLWEGPREALGLLELPSEHDSDFHEYFLHPTIMDGALQATIGLTGAPRSGQPVLPFGVEEVELLRPLKRRGYAYVTPGRQPLQFNVTIVDDTGLVCVEIHGAAFRELKDPLQKLFYVPTWKRQPLTSERSSLNHHADNGQVLIVYSAQSSGLAQALGAAHPAEEVVSICLGSETRTSSPDSWEIKTDDATALDKCLQTLQDIQTIYFLGGIQTPDRDPADLTTLAQSQESGVISLFRLVKTLLRQSYGGKALRLKVVTNDASEVTPGATRNPFAASLVGFCKSLAKEQARWEVSCLDVSLEAAEGWQTLVDSIQSEPRLSTGEEVAIRQGVRYARTIRPLALPSTTQAPFKPHGVYLILGGAGGIGMELSSYLAETVQARVVLVGRSELTEEQQKKIACIEAKGAEVLYLQADATNATALKAAVEKAKERFGRINGVIHSAIVLEDKALENMDENALRAVLAPKVTGAVALYQALQGEELDFMLFFSSIQTICGNPGQSNYAAACTFKDAYAHYLRSKVVYPVKIINWGYWGEVGIVATEEHQRRLAAQGIYSISPAEGMEAVRRTLAHPVTQVMPIKASADLLSMMGVDLTQRVELLPEDDLVTSISAIERTAQPAVKAEHVEKTVAAFNQLDEFGQHLLLAAFQRNGVFRRSGEGYDKDDLRHQLKIIPTYFRLYEALLKILEKAGLISVNGHRLVGSSSLANADLQEDLKHLELKKNQLTEDLPEIAPHIRLLWACGQHYLEILQGKCAATDIVFPGHSMEQVEGIYKGNTLVDYFNQLVVWSLQSYIEKRLPQLRADEKITILEIGAGTGGTSAAIFDALSRYAQRLRYLYTDISAHFTQSGKRQYAASNPHVEFQVLDIERDVESQGYEVGACDVVIATNVLHATRQIERTLSHAKSLLRSHGWLIVNEVTEEQDFTTLTFGLLEGWWLYEDEQHRLEYSPLLSAGDWKRLLKELGFERALTLALPGPNGRRLGQNVIVAESNGLIVRSNAPLSMKAAEASLVQTTNVTHAHLPLGEKLNTATTASVQTMSASATTSAIDKETLRLHVENKIIESLALVLQLSEEVFDKNTPYTEFGVDSLLAVDVINKLNEVPGIDLRSTDLFNYSTVRQLTDYIVEECGTDLRKVLLSEASAAETQPDLSVEAGGERSLQAVVPAGPLQTVTLQQTQDVAVIGISGQFPEAKNIHEYWNNLSGGRNSVREITRWKDDEFYDPDPRALNKSYSKWGGMLDDIHQFEPTFFSISPREAELMDPQQRLFLQETWKALEDAGYSDKELEGKNCSVFVGCGSGDYSVKLKENNVPLEAYSFTGNASSILTARISYLLNLKGASVPIDTACSSSLVAIHLACESIRHGLSEMAIVGGVAVMNTPDFHILGSRGGMLSVEGQCKTFDDTADGFVPGEAVGALILKNMDAALRDGDHIYGIIS
ncbi:MAG TPA: SDR family NAD(P)-dependent oxidoreductase, partial [Pyrinomonadaceae bacterium]|nr:SDR family NAD(P)-dependent oxidoreductase [Pyrinomonadaceae bacterium]